MKVLHLPYNIASQVSITIRALRDIGVDARGLVVNNNPIQGKTGIENVHIPSPRRDPISWVKQNYSWWKKFKAAVDWADVIHWYYGNTILPGELELRYIASQKKARVVEFFGSDIRIPEIAIQDNQYLQRLLKNPKSEYVLTYLKSRQKQARFARYGFLCIVPTIELNQYIQHDLFPSIIKTDLRLVMSDYDPQYSNLDRSVPVIAHAPSRLGVKGTPTVLEAMNQLKSEFDFEFNLIHKVPHTKAIEMIRNCDIFLDQFVLGFHGVAALEAMALGKPVVCYVNHSLVSKLPPDYPIINAHQENLVQVIAKLLNDPHRRIQIGRDSRAYVEKHHDAHQIARRLRANYRELIESNAQH